MLMVNTRCLCEGIVLTINTRCHYEGTVVNSRSVSVNVNHINVNQGVSE